jgi:hypothetical protein
MTITINRDDLKQLVRDLMQEVLWEMEQLSPDPDRGLDVRPEIAGYLRQSAGEKGPLKSLDEVKRELGLDE